MVTVSVGTAMYPVSQAHGTVTVDTTTQFATMQGPPAEAVGLQLLGRTVEVMVGHEFVVFWARVTL